MQIKPLAHFGMYIQPWLHAHMLISPWAYAPKLYLWIPVWLVSLKDYLATETKIGVQV